MIKFLKNLFKRKVKIEEKDVSLLQKEEEFENINNFSNDSADLNIKTVTDSRSTIFFKEASSILEEDKEEIPNLNHFIGKNDEKRENSSNIKESIDYF